MPKIRYQTTLSLTAEENQLVEDLKKKKISKIEIFRQGLIVLQKTLIEKKQK